MANEATPLNPLRRWGPVVGLAIVAIVVGILVLSGGDDPAGPVTQDTEQDGSTDVEGAATATTPAEPDPGEPSGDDPLWADGMVRWTEALQADRIEDFDWGSRCDTDLGTYAYPDPQAGECVAIWEGDNGGATGTGVTEDTITIVVYSRPQNDPVMNFVLGPIQNSDTRDDQFATFEGLVELYGSYFETYGRSIELVRYEASGFSNDQVAAIADAEAIAREIRPFMVWGHPALQEDVFAETLAANGVMCACGIGEVARANHPYLHSIQMSADQNRWVLAEYIGKRLAGGNAVHSPDYAGQPRRFAYLYADVGEQANTFAEDFAAVLTQEWDVELAQLVPYVFDPNSLQEQAANIIASLKADGITSIVFVGPPTAPRQFTTAATEQDYFPEWILSGALLVDTNVFARTYDQTQWANAFGLSITAVPIDRSAGGPSYLYNWFHGDVAPADDSVGAMWMPATTFAGIQGAGPDLTPQSYMDGLAASGSRSRSMLTTARVSWGSEAGIWPDHLLPDVAGFDDTAEIWWDPATEGPDELGRVGAGVYQYVDGGSRFVAGEWPSGPPAVFDADNSVSRYDTVPEDESVPNYSSPAG